MRAGEIAGLTRKAVDLSRRVAHLPKTKNGTARSVPLSSEAVKLIEALPEADPILGLTARELDVRWRALRDRAGVKGLVFHDSRAFATGRLAKKVDVLTLARITGHKDVRMLMTYYRISAEEIAKML
tara:strand:- start:2089 stop:2469 length:381 start_codon:yes stop_codon:yes gene_type:complete